MPERRAQSLGSAFSEVMSRAGRGDGAARAALYLCYGGTVLARVQRRLPPVLRSKYDAMDLVHSVFAELLHQLPRIQDRGERAFVRLLTVKAENLVRIKLRRHLGKDRGRLELQLEPDSRPMAVASDAHAAVDHADDAQRLQHLLDGLNVPSKTLLRLHAEGRGFAEIASTLGLSSADAARKKHARLISSLREEWGRSLDRRARSTR